VYWRLGTLNIAKPLIRSVESPSFLPVDRFPLSQQVTYRYFTGLKAVLDGAYQDAARSLTLALELCDPNHARNRRAIMVYLVPVLMTTGRLPSAGTLAEHGLTAYLEVRNAVVAGDGLSFDSAVARHEEFLVRKGTLLLVEKLKSLLYRNLLKKIFLALGQETRLPLTAVQAALKVLGAEPLDLDEIECIVANLIVSGLVKGYIAHKQRILVLAKGGSAGAFPPVTVVMTQ
jgi:hypothetical protein